MVVDRRHALKEAMQALQDGPAEPTSIEGAKVNALHSIAWSLIGLLAKDLDKDQEGLKEALERMTLHQANR